MISAKTLSIASMNQLAAMALCGLFCMWRWPAGLSGVLMGGLVMAANLSVGRYLATKVMGNPHPQAIYVVALSLKFVFLLLLVAAILYFLQPNIAAFAVGLSTFFVGVTVAMLRQSMDTRRTLVQSK